MFRLGRQLSRRLNMKIVPVPVREDNYAYILIDQPSNKAAFVDPFDLPKVASVAESLGVSVVASITTHHHFDHSGGNKVLILDSKILSADNLRLLQLPGFRASDIQLRCTGTLIHCLAGRQISRCPNLWRK
jgi:glyoxylase-like metal-dependent hydrolase (beta-lactamase superfamily II)